MKITDLPNEVLIHVFEYCINPNMTVKELQQNVAQIRRVCNKFAISSQTLIPTKSELPNEFKKNPDLYQWNIFHFAIITEKIGLIKLLLAQGADIFKKQSIQSINTKLNAYTPINLAFNKSPKVLLILLKDGATKGSLLNWAATNEYGDLLVSLIGLSYSTLGNSGNKRKLCNTYIDLQAFNAKVSTNFLFYLVSTIILRLLLLPRPTFDNDIREIMANLVMIIDLMLKKGININETYNHVTIFQEFFEAYNTGNFFEETPVADVFINYFFSKLPPPPRNPTEVDQLQKTVLDFVNFIGGTTEKPSLLIPTLTLLLLTHGAKTYAELKQEKLKITDKTKEYDSRF